jgi:hypothetical protein
MRCCNDLKPDGGLAGWKQKQTDKQWGQCKLIKGKTSSRSYPRSSKIWILKGKNMIRYDVQWDKRSDGAESKHD